MRPHETLALYKSLIVTLILFCVSWGLMGSHVGLMRDSFKTLGSHGPKSFALVRKEGGHQLFHILTTLVPPAGSEGANFASS